MKITIIAISIITFDQNNLLRWISINLSQILVVIIFKEFEANCILFINLEIASEIP